MECTKNSTKREVYSNTILPQETRKTPSRQPKFTPKTTGKTTTTTTISRRKEIIKIRAEINEKHRIDNLTLHLKQLEKEEQKKPQDQQKETNHKDPNRSK